MKSTIKVFSVLETLCEGKAAGVSELSAQLDIKPSTMHRFLSVLTKMGYVEKNENTGKYAASLKVFQLGISVRNKLSLIGIARPLMEAMSEKYHETVNIALFAENSVVVIDRVQSNEALRTNIVLGQHLPAHCTAFGKIFLADMLPKKLDAFLAAKTLAPFTKFSITGKEKLLVELARIRKAGYAVDNRELDANIRCVAAPIRNENGEVAAAVSVSGPISRFKMVRIKSLIPSILATTDDISRKLGFDPKIHERTGRK